MDHQGGGAQCHRHGGLAVHSLSGQTDDGGNNNQDGAVSVHDQRVCDDTLSPDRAIRSADQREHPLVMNSNTARLVSAQWVTQTVDHTFVSQAHFSRTEGDEVRMRIDITSADGHDFDPPVFRGEDVLPNPDRALEEVLRRTRPESSRLHSLLYEGPAGQCTIELSPGADRATASTPDGPAETFWGQDALQQAVLWAQQECSSPERDQPAPRFTYARWSHLSDQKVYQMRVEDPALDGEPYKVVVEMISTGGFRLDLRPEGPIHVTTRTTHDPNAELSRLMEVIDSEQNQRLLEVTWVHPDGILRLDCNSQRTELFFEPYRRSLRCDLGQDTTSEIIGLVARGQKF